MKKEFEVATYVGTPTWILDENQKRSFLGYGMTGFVRDFGKNPFKPCAKKYLFWENFKLSLAPLIIEEGELYFPAKNTYNQPCFQRL